jgi:hypothetical protein
MEAFIRDAFERNFSILRIETGIAIAPDTKQAALHQVLLYWRRLQDIARRVTDTEVRLSLPRNESPRGREFGIEGVVDIVREEDRTTMYDIKTHDADFIHLNLELYQDQLNTYAHIWQKLYKQPLDETAIICTDFPEQVENALLSGDPARIERALAQWEPVIELEINPQKVDHTIREFGAVVDQIEEHVFAPPNAAELERTFPTGRNERFATRVCRNCDARFSCSAYRRYARHGRGRIEQRFSQYYRDLEAGDSLEAWRTAGMDEMPEVEDLI